MPSTSRSLLAAAASLVTLAACDDVTSKPVTPPDPTATIAQTWICGREYENFAWGHQRRGVVLDAQGKLWRYDVKGAPRDSQWHPKDLANMSEEELNLRYAGAQEAGTISIEEIARHLPLIEEASKTKPTEPRGVGADMGANILYCLNYDAATRSYEQVMLDQKGDFESANPSDAAKTLNAWLSTRLGEVK